MYPQISRPHNAAMMHSVCVTYQRKSEAVSFKCPRRKNLQLKRTPIRERLLTVLSVTLLGFKFRGIKVTQLSSEKVFLLHLVYSQPNFLFPLIFRVITKRMQTLNKSRNIICQREWFLHNVLYKTPLTNILPFHWFRARHTICLSFITRNGGCVIVHHLPCDSLTTIKRRAEPRRLFTHFEPNQLCVCVSEMRVRTLCVRG